MMFFLVAQADQKTSNNNHNDFRSLQKEITELLLKKQRPLAVKKIELVMENFSASDKIKALILKQTLLTYFLSLKTQESYEIAVGQLFFNKKNSYKNLQICLADEPDNLYCLWQELKYTKFYDSSDFKEKAQQFLQITKDLPDFFEMSQSIDLDRNLNLPALERSLKSGVFEKEVLSAAILYKQALLDLDYNKAREMVKKIEQIASDYPDLIFMRTQIEALTRVDSKTTKNSYETYKKICTDLNINTVSKYYFDIELCTRSLNP